MELTKAVNAWLKVPGSEDHGYIEEFDLIQPRSMGFIDNAVHWKDAIKVENLTHMTRLIT